jgi:formate--tetrahydrofolate ligase
LSCDPHLPGAPRGWRLPVREARAAVGAGYVYVISGDMQTMPGVGAHPAIETIDLDGDGNVVGLMQNHVAP